MEHWARGSENGDVGFSVTDGLEPIRGGVREKKSQPFGVGGCGKWTRSNKKSHGGNRHVMTVY